MRKRGLPLVLAAVVLVAVLVGCFNRHNTAQNASMQSEFKVIAQITYQDIKAKAEISKTGEVYQIKLTEPENLKGMQFDYDGERVTVSYLGLSVGVDKNTLLSSMATALISSMDNALVDSNTSITNDGGNFVVKGKTESGNYKLAVDRKSGMPVSLELPDLAFSCQFSKPE